MPELPEVETIVRELKAAKLEGQCMADVYVHWPRIVEPSPKKFITQLKGQKICKIERRGKYIVFTLDHASLLVHLRMTGKFELIPKDSPIHQHEHLRLIFKDGRALRYEDPRKFGRWSLLKRQPKNSVN